MQARGTPPQKLPDSRALQQHQGPTTRAQPKLNPRRDHPHPTASMSNRTIDRNQATSHDRAPSGGLSGKGQTRPSRTCSVQSERKHRALGRLQNSSSGTTEARHLASFLKRVFDRTRRSGKLLPRWRGTMFCSLRSWAISSGGEHYLDTVGVTSSNLVSPTMKDQVIGCFSRWPFLFPKPEGTLRTQSGRIARTHAPPPPPKSGSASDPLRSVLLQPSCRVALRRRASQLSSSEAAKTDRSASCGAALRRAGPQAIARPPRGRRRTLPRKPRVLPFDRIALEQL